MADNRDATAPVATIGIRQCGKKPPCEVDGSPGDWQLCEWINLCRAVEESGRFDVVHAHAYLWGLPLTRVARAAMVHTTHVMPSVDQVSATALNPPGAYIKSGGPEPTTS